MAVIARVPRPPLAGLDDDVEYPEEDLNPVPEERAHLNQAFEIYERLQLHFADDPSAYVSGNDFIYLEPGVNTARVSPDVYVVQGIGNRPRTTYRVWEEGKGPDFVVEVLSPHTRAYDAKGKRDFYQDVLKVKEYFRFDPKARRGARSLWGDRLENGKYVPLVARDGRLRSEVLGADLVVEEGRLQFYDLVTGKRWLTPRELERQEKERERQEKLAAQRERDRALALAREQSARADGESARADLESARAAAEAAARGEAEAELARLRALMESRLREPRPENRVAR